MAKKNLLSGGEKIFLNIHPALLAKLDEKVKAYNEEKMSSGKNLHEISRNQYIRKLIMNDVDMTYDDFIGK